MGSKWEELESKESAARALEKLLYEKHMSHVETASYVMGEAMLSCESPIERVMFFSLASALYEDRWGLAIGSFELDTKVFHGVCEIEPQAVIGSFRVDFLIKDPFYDLQFVVECDGHDFHERTKEQARRDKFRDRALKLLGFEVLHFTGSEIWADPDKCASEVVAAINARIERDSKIRGQKTDTNDGDQSGPGFF